MFVDDIDPENLPDVWKKGCIDYLGEVVGGATPFSLISLNLKTLLNEI